MDEGVLDVIGIHEGVVVAGLVGQEEEHEEEEDVDDTLFEYGLHL